MKLQRRKFLHLATGTAALPLATAQDHKRAFDGDTGLIEAAFPSLPFLHGDGKSHVDRTLPVMRRNSAAGKMHGLQRVAAQKQQQHAAMTDVVSAKPRIAINAVQAKDLFIKRTGALECLNVKNGFQNAEERRHSPFPFSHAAVSAGGTTRR